MKRLCGYLVSMFILICSWQAHAVDYTLPDLDGQLQSLDQYRGKWVVVNYWATWCSTCLKEIPDLVSLHEDNKDIVVVGINFENISRNRLKTFVEGRSLPYPVLRSKPVAETPLGAVPALPTTYIIDPDGNIVAGEVGVVTQKDLENYIERKKATAFRDGFIS